MYAVSAAALVLPDVPADQQHRSVAAWAEPVDLPTYEPDPPSPYPSFTASRVYQGASGRVYPLGLVERIAAAATPRSWQGLHLQNRWLRVLVLPELGGRIHLAVDRTTGYDLFSRQDTVKPALVGLAGPWVAGGVELNWPQHHRPATYADVDWCIERGADGSVTVWCSDHDPVARMKGMHGVTLHPGRADLELRVRLHNRTEDVQTFLWWANAAVRVHADYQTFFPPDVHHVVDHARRAVATYPAATGSYYGVDYPAQVSAGRPDGDRLDWPRNIEVPTSFMATGSSQDFVGGYDHAAGVGVVHWADHRIAPGKKVWTWGDSAFGAAWQRNLSDDGGAYVELMAGVFTDNQPDFSFLAPGETKVFSQHWFPVTGTGPVHAATLAAAGRLDVTVGASGTTVRVGVAVTAERPGAVVIVTGAAGSTLAHWVADLAPGRPLLAEKVIDAGVVDSADLDGPGHVADLVLRVEHAGEVLLTWRPAAVVKPGAVPSLATAPPPPALVREVEELDLIGLHLWQNRHPSRAPEPYWEESLRRDPGGSRAHLGLSAACYRRGEQAAAAAHARAAVARLSARNANPADGAAHYRLGLALRRLGDTEGAYDAFAKAAWDVRWSAPASLALAQLDAAAGAAVSARGSASLSALAHARTALAHTLSALRTNAEDLRARDLQVLLLRRLGRATEAATLLEQTRRLDPLDWWARDLAGEPLGCDARTCLDVALEYAAAGALADALRVLDRAVVVAGAAAPGPQGLGLLPLLDYHRALLLQRRGDDVAASAARARAQRASAAGCFPTGLDDEAALRAARAADPRDLAAAALLATWCFDAGRTREALELWREAAGGPGGAATGPRAGGEAGTVSALVWRNLALATAEVEGDLVAAVHLLEAAVAAAPDDARLRWERDRAAAGAGVGAAERLAALRERPDLVAARDDATVELALLHDDVGQPEVARDLLRGRRFQPWEGGEGSVLAAWERTALLLAGAALRAGDPTAARVAVLAAIEPPEQLGETRHPLADAAPLWLALGDALAAAGDEPGARAAWERAAGTGVGAGVGAGAVGPTTVCAALAWQRLGDDARAGAALGDLEQAAVELRATEPVVDFFATSLPDGAPSVAELASRRDDLADLLQAQASQAAGATVAARGHVERLLRRTPGHRPGLDLLRTLGVAGTAAGP